MSDIELVLLGAGGSIILMLMFIFLLFSKSNENSKQIRFLANTLDSFNKDVFEIERKLEKLAIHIKESEAVTDTNAMQRQIENNVAQFAEPIAQSLDDILASFSHFKSQIQGRMENVEEGIKSVALPKSITGLDDQKVLALHKQGLSEEMIAKELGISKGEVYFSLKISKMQ